MKSQRFSYYVFTIVFITLHFCVGSAQNDNKNQEDYKTIFNGKDLTGWSTKIHHYEFNDNHGETFRVEDSIIKVRYDKYQGGFNDRFGHLYFDTPYSYFHLSMEYRFVGEPHPGAPIYIVQNSGVMFHSQDPRTILKDQNWPISVEMQFLGGLEEGKERPTGNMCSPGTDVEYKGKIDPNHCINSTSKTYFGEQWIKAELIVRGDSLVTHIINGETVLEYTKPRVGGGVVKGYDPKMKPDGQLLKDGFIALQSEGQPIDFRNIKIKDLSGTK